MMAITTNNSISVNAFRAFKARTSMIREFNGSTASEGPAALHYPLQFLEDWRQFGFRLRRALSVKCLEPECSHLRLKLCAQLGRCVRSVRILSRAFWRPRLLLAQMSQRIFNCLPTLLFGQLFEC